ncbi:hypothetical protein [Litchfieldia alkalitelluris]|uniref:hypothetical protein n=1 Tax=Litchfieldia alkalitelluris TaxID=304268 RepID=UPI001473F621|nr:hypothetical protein [Litchfieldia alkalitelluris]
MESNRQIVGYWCDCCEFEFALYNRFPDDIMPYCPNCSGDEDIIEVSIIDITKEAFI